MSILMETYIPGLQQNGFITGLNATFNGNLTVVGTTTITGGVTFVDLTTTGNTVLGNAVSDTTTVNGVLTVTSTATVVGAVVAGGVAAKSATAVPATAGAVAAGAPITMFSSNISIWVTSDAPTHTATKGDLCINTGGSSTSTRLYVNNGTTSWIAITTAS